MVHFLKNLGVNALLNFWFAVIKAADKHLNVLFYLYLGDINNKIISTPYKNVINGGSHSNLTIHFQEFSLFQLDLKLLKMI
jgi:enolase